MVNVYHVHHTTWNLCQTCSKSTQQVYFTRVSKHVNHVYHVQHTTWNLCETCSKGTQLCLFNKRPEPLVCILLQLSSALHKIFFNQFGVAKFRIQLHPWLPLRVVTSLPTVLVMTTCFDPEFCFLRLIWVFFPSCVLLRTDLTWLFLGVCVLSTHHRVQRVLEMQCT
jgi:hypothetical protein